jgi:5-methyltetrahydrofolate--homocysteine methyltransferase
MAIENAKQLEILIKERILILDGAMGSMLQDYKLSEVLCLEKPELITQVHEAYLEAGADIISTCSFNANAVSLTGYQIAEKAYEISKAAGKLARQAADKYSTSEKKRFAAGSMGPTPKSACFYPDINDPAKRNINWDELETTYYDNARGLLDGGVDLLLVETIFDTINAKAAISAVMRLREERNIPIPLIISASLANKAGRILSGQTLEAFAVSVSHAYPLAIGLNCSYGADIMFPYISQLSTFTQYPVIFYPNAGLPEKTGDYCERPEKTAETFKKYFERKLINIAGGCCGTTPEHIAAISKIAKNYSPRLIQEKYNRHFLSGLEVFSLPSDAYCHMNKYPVECFNEKAILKTTGKFNSRKAESLSDCLKNNCIEDAFDLANEIIDEGAKILPVHIAPELPGGKETVTRFFNTLLFDPSIARHPILLECSNYKFLESALKCIQGKSLVNVKNLRVSEGEFSCYIALIRRLGAAMVC